jgi:demethoxyubiquinone hydroxylase (CLK1/Coq7/Cat5 family)
MKIAIQIEQNVSGCSVHSSKIVGDQVQAQFLHGVIDVAKNHTKLHMANLNQSTEDISEKSIWEIAQEIVKQMTDEEVAHLPKDGAEQHDYYIYGTPKRQS